MRVIRMYRYCFILFLGILLLLTKATVVLAAGSITNLGYFKYADQIKTPAENTFMMHYGAQTKVELLMGEYHSGELFVNDEHPQSSALIKHVGFYKGQDVNVKLSLLKQSGQSGGKIGLDTDASFLSITVSGQMKVTYAFQDQKGQPLSVATSFMYEGLNINKRVGFNHRASTIRYLVGNRPTDISYTSDGSWLFLENNSHTPWRHPTQSVQVITYERSIIETDIKNLDSTPSSLMYYTNFLAPPTFSKAEGLNKTYENPDATISLNAVQTVPKISGNSPMHQLQVRFTPKTAIEKQQYEPNGFKVTSFDGTDVTNLFTGKKQGNDYLIQAKALSNKDLYDTVLNYQVPLKWLGSKQKPVAPELLTDSYLKIPFQVATTIDNQTEESSQGATQVKYLGEVHLRYVDENGKSLRPSKTIQGTITNAFDVSQEYPEIKGYYPVKSDIVNDQGIFTPQPQSIIHCYKKGQPLELKLEGAENPLHISRISHSRQLKFRIKHDQEDTVTLYAEALGVKRKLKTYTKMPIEIQDQLNFQPPLDWLDNNVKFFVENQQKEQSNLEVRYLYLEQGPQLKLPATLNFGQHTISDQNKLVTAVNQDEISVQDDSQLDKQDWRIKLKIKTPLINQNNEELTAPFKCHIQQQDYLLNQAEQVVWNGKGNCSLQPDDKFQLSISPAANTGYYSGTLQWDLENAP